MPPSPTRPCAPPRDEPTTASAGRSAASAAWRPAAGEGAAISRTSARERARFDDEYRRRYGHANAAAEVELVVLHSLATMQMKRPDIARLARATGDRKTPELEVRPIYFLDEDRFLPTQIYDRYALGPGFHRAGPALIVEYGSSTLIGPRDSFTIGKLGEIDIDCSR